MHTTIIIIIVIIIKLITITFIIIIIIIIIIITRSFDISIMGRTFDVADLRNHKTKVRPIFIIYNNYSYILKIEIIGSHIIIIITIYYYYYNYI